MLKVNVHDAKTNLSRYLELAEKGELVVLCRRNEPVAELRAIPKPERKVPEIGFAAGTFEIPTSFFDPLPDDILAAFEGRGE